MLLSLAAAVTFCVLVAACWYVREHAPELRRAAACWLLSRWLGVEVELRSFDVSIRAIHMWGLTVLNPEVEGVSWARRHVAKVQEVNISLAHAGLAGCLAAIGPVRCSLLGIEVAAGALRRRVASMHFEGLELNMEELPNGSGSTVSNLWSVPYLSCEVEPPLAAAEATGGGGDAPTGDLTTDSDGGRARRPRKTFSSSVRARIRDGLRDGLAVAVGDGVSRAVWQEQYDDHMRALQRQALEEALATVHEHMSIGRLSIAAMLVRGAVTSAQQPGAPLLCDEFAVCDFEGSSAQLASAVVSGVMARMLRDGGSQLQLVAAAREASERRLLEAAKGAARLPRAARDAAKGAAREVAKGALKEVHEVRDAAREVAHDAKELVQAGLQASVAEARAGVAEARAAVESGATFAKARARDAGALFGSSLGGLPTSLPSMGKWGLTPWNGRSTKRSEEHGGTTSPLRDATNVHGR